MSPDGRATGSARRESRSTPWPLKYRSFLPLRFFLLFFFFDLPACASAAPQLPSLVPGTGAARANASVAATVRWPILIRSPALCADVAKKPQNPRGYEGSGPTLQVFERGGNRRGNRNVHQLD